MKTITIEIPEGKRAEWVDGVLTLVDEAPKDITERIKTFEDACEWCEKINRTDVTSGYYLLTADYDSVHIDEDIIAYLKLRVITCALNEGWKPTFEEGEERYVIYFDSGNYLKSADGLEIRTIQTPSALVYKSDKLAKYAATQFKDIYMDFCYKGKE